MAGQNMAEQNMARKRKRSSNAARAFNRIRGMTITTRTNLIASQESSDGQTNGQSTQQSIPQSNGQSTQHRTNEDGSRNGQSTHQSNDDCNQQSTEHTIEEGVEITGSSGATITRRGPTRLKDVWSLPEESRIVVPFSECSGQPIKLPGGLLGQFLGCLVKNSLLVPIDFEDWRLIPQDRKSAMLAVVKSKFSYPDIHNRWVLMSLGDKLREHKGKLKAKYFLKHPTKEELIRNKPADIPADQWSKIATYWHSRKGKEKSRKNTEIRKLLKVAHTCGTKSFARKAQEIFELTRKRLTRGKLYLETHQRKDGSYATPETAAFAEKLIAQMQELESSQNSIEEVINPNDTTAVVINPGDSFAKVFGEDRSGRVGGLGLGPCPSKVYGTSSRRFAGMTVISSRDNGEEVRRLNETVKTQGAKVVQLEAALEKYMGIVDRLQTMIDAQCANDVSQVQETSSSHGRGLSSSGSGRRRSNKSVNATQ